jgi:hypothetical protein
MVLAGHGGGGWQVEVVIVVVVGHSGGGGADLNLFIRQTSTFIDLRPTGFTSDWVVPQSQRIVVTAVAVIVVPPLRRAVFGRWPMIRMNLTVHRRRFGWHRIAAWWMPAPLAGTGIS